ncbi:hypothetical protein RB200_28650 [Streptomyces sp. PmtG]
MSVPQAPSGPESTSPAPGPEPRPRGSGGGNSGASGKTAVVVAVIGALALIAAAFVPELFDRESESEEQEDLFVGEWQGNVRELEQPYTPYRVTLEVGEGKRGEEVGRIFYESKGRECSGVVTLQDKNEASKTIELGEYIKVGNCVKRGRIVLKIRPADEAEFFYTGSKATGVDQSVQGSLGKVG